MSDWQADGIQGSMSSYWLFFDHDETDWQVETPQVVTEALVPPPTDRYQVET